MYRTAKARQPEPPERRTAYWRYKVARVGAWCWRALKRDAVWGSLAVIGLSLAIVLGIHWVSVAFEEAKREREAWPCRETVTEGPCPRPDHRITVEGGLAICRCPKGEP